MTIALNAKSQQINMFSAAKTMAKCSRGEVGPACEPGASLSSIDLSNLTPKANQLRKKLTSNRLTSNEQTTEELNSDRLASDFKWAKLN